MLTVAIYYVWMVTLAPKSAENVDVDASSIAADASAAGSSSPAPSATGVEASATGVGSTATGVGTSTVGTPLAPTDAPLRQVELEGCGANFTASSVGGGLSNVRLRDFNAHYDMMPVWSWLIGGGGEWLPYGSDPGPAIVLSERAQALVAGAGALDAPLPKLALDYSGSDGSAPGGSDGSAPGASATSVSFSGMTAAGVEVRSSIATQRATADGPCTTIVEITWRNPSPDPWQGDVWVGMHDDLPELTGGIFAGYESVSALWAMTGGSVHTETSPSMIAAAAKSEAVALEGAVDWFGIADNYFTLVALPDESAGSPAGRVIVSSRPTQTASLVGTQYIVPVNLAGGEAFTRRFTVYTGAKTFESLGAVDERLTELVQLGWFAFFAKPLLWLLTFFHGVSGDWGVAIILLTVTIKLLFFPLTQSGMRSAQAMQAIGPQMQLIREQYKDDPEQLNRKTMELFRENKVNPIGGCLPMLIQTPVWIGFFSALRSSVDLYQVEFLYLKDLSSVDPYAVLPFVVVLLMAAQQQLTPMGNMDPAQARMMKLMPIVFGLFFFTLPSGLVVYIFVNMLLSLGQQWLIKRSFQTAETQPAVA